MLTCAVVCRRTTCFLTRQGVAKFSWRSDLRQPLEVKHLQLAREKGVTGVATLVGHREITSIADSRAGLDFSISTRLSFRTTAQSRSDGYNRLRSLASSGSSRKRWSSEEDTRPATRRRSNSIGSSLRQSFGHSSEVIGEVDEVDEENEGSPEANAEVGKAHEVGEKAKPSLYTKNKDQPYENRISSCLIISPAGRIISDFRTIRELLESLRDAIKAHQSLYVKGGILHRDISSNNIIIIDPDSKNNSDGFKGMLIDLDLAKELNSGPSEARHQTGTMQFMAVEVLRGIDHTYRHDLESFFYVLLWICARKAWADGKGLHGNGKPAAHGGILRGWEVGSFGEIADAKEGHMTINGLERLMGEFPESFSVIKPLCLRIRSILFGDTARLVVGMPVGGLERLYSAMIAAYDETIEQL